MMKEVILIFDVGKTNKKVLLFDQNLKVLYEEESIFEEVMDDEGFPCDDADRLESWIQTTLDRFLDMEEYRVRGINVSTYGATLVYLDAKGKRLTPIYNYLKTMPEQVLEGFYERFGGEEEFSRNSASPALGMLNSGLQILSLKHSRPEIFEKVNHILHLPQYLSYLIHGKIASEHTSIGCHTAMWDFDHMCYHPWLKAEGIALSEPEAVSRTFQLERGGISLETGIGIHDSSSSLAPYILTAKEPFVVISTGTWCISMNPFNNEPLTSVELKQDCLCFLGVGGEPVKSSRFFMGHIHDLNVEPIQKHFQVNQSAYKTVSPDLETIQKVWEEGEGGQVFFRGGIPGDWVDHQADISQFLSFEEAYLQLMVDLFRYAIQAIELILANNDHTRHLYITGGFAKSSIFTTILSLAFPGKKVFTSEVDNATSLGAALVIAEELWEGSLQRLDLGLKEIRLNTF